MSGLFTTQIGYSHGAEIGAAAAAQMERLAYYPNWAATQPGDARADRAHPRARAAADGARVLHLGRLRVGRVGLEAGAPALPRARRELAPHRHLAPRLLPRLLARSALDHGHPGCARRPSSRSCPTRATSLNTDPRQNPGDDPLAAADAIEQAILAEGPENVCMVILEPVQNAGGTLVPPPGYAQRVREICDRHGVLLCCDEVICAFGRLGHWFGSERLGFTPDLITFAKGVTSGLRAARRRDLQRGASPRRCSRAEGLYAHGYTFGGHPVSCAVALANLAIMERVGALANVLEVEPYLESVLNEVAAVLADRRRGARLRLLPLARARRRGARRPRARGHAGARRDRAHRRARQPVPRDLAAAHQRPLARRRARRGAGGRAGRDRRVTAPFRPALDGLVPYEPGRPVEIVQRELGLDRADRQARLERGARGARCRRRSRRSCAPPAAATATPTAAATRCARRSPSGTAWPSSRSWSATAPTASSTTSRSRCSSRATRSRSAGRRSRSTRSTPPRWAPSPVRAPLAGSSYDLDALAACVDERTKIVYVTNPNNPTGGMVDARRARALPRRAARARAAGARRGLLRVRRRSRLPRRRERAPRARAAAASCCARSRRSTGWPGFRVGYGLVPARRRGGLPQGQERVRRDAVGAGRRAREPRRGRRGRAARATRRARGASASPRGCASAGFEPLDGRRELPLRRRRGRRGVRRARSSARA